MNFDFDSQTRRGLGQQLIDVVDGFLGSLPDRPVQPLAENRAYPAHLSSRPETGEDPGKVLNEAGRELLDNGFHIPSAHYLGMMNPAPTYMGATVNGESVIRTMIICYLRKERHLQSLQAVLQAAALRVVPALSVGW